MATLLLTQSVLDRGQAFSLASLIVTRSFEQVSLDFVDAILLVDVMGGL